MNIGIDIDDTISKTAELMIGYANIYNIEVVQKEIKQGKMGNVKTHQYLNALYGWSNEEKQAFFEKYYGNILEEVRPKENVSEVLKKIKQEGNKIFFITARLTNIKNTPTLKITKEWLRKNEIPYDELIMDAKDKLIVCKEKNIDLFIDDSLENCKKMFENNIQAYLMNSIVNKNIEEENITRVKSWDEVYEKIDCVKI